jgi:hypothetical protein
MSLYKYGPFVFVIDNKLSREGVEPLLSGESVGWTIGRTIRKLRRSTRVAFKKGDFE